MSVADRMRVQFTRPYRVYRKGEVIEMDRGPAKSLVLAGIVAPAQEEQRIIEDAMVERRAETADAPRRRRRR